MKCTGKYAKYACNSIIGCGEPHCPVMQQNGITDIMFDVETFHIAVDQPVVDKPTVPSDERVYLRANLMIEEFFETLTSLYPNLGYEIAFGGKTDVDMIALADGLADLIYVAVGTALEFGIPLDKVWAEVQRSNMDKVRGGIRRRDDGKILKPADWQGPDIEGCLK